MQLGKPRPGAQKKMKKKNLVKIEFAPFFDGRER